MKNYKTDCRYIPIVERLLKKISIQANGLYTHYRFEMVIWR